MAILNVSLTDNSHQSLQDIITHSSVASLLPLACHFTATALTLTQESKASEPTELVVLGTLSIAQLQHILQKCQLTSVALTAINYRNNLHSYRFSVECNDLTNARNTLATLALAEKFEAALLQNAPKLAVPGVLVMDMDSTTIKIECIDEIAELAGVGEQVSAVTELAMQGELDFAQSLHQRVATLANAPESILENVARNIPLMEGLETLISALKQHNWRIAIASGGFTYFAEHLQNMLALDDVRANVLEISNGKLTGKVLGNVIDAQAKADCLNELQQKYHLLPEQTVAMGDGANDLVMMNAASLGVAFHAKPIVLKQADCAINQHGLDYLLHWLA